METILIHVHIDTLCVPAWLGIVDYSATDLVLGTYFISCHIQAIIPEEHNVVSRHSAPFAIIKLPNALVSSLEKTIRNTESESNLSAPVNVSGKVPVAPFTQYLVQASTSMHVLLIITPIRAEGKVSKTGIIAAYGVIDVFLQPPF